MSRDKVDFPSELLARAYLGKSETIMFQWLLPALLRRRPKLVICEFAIGYGTLWVLLLLRLFFRFRLVFWGHGVRNEQILTPFQGWKGKLVLFLYRRADGLLFYSADRRDMVAHSLGNSIPLFVAPNSLDISSFNQVYERLEKEGREQVRARLGMDSGTFHLVWVGRLIPDKRPDLLFDAMEQLKGRGKFHLHVVGSGPELISLRERRLPSVTFYGEIHDEQCTGEILFGSDLFVMPGYLGLSILHAFVMGVPVVSCQTTAAGPFHSPETFYLKEGENGYLVGNSAEEVVEIIDKIRQAPDLQSRMSRSARSTAHAAGISPMVEGFRAVSKCLGSR